MRQDTPFGPVWMVPDMLGEKGAKIHARLDLAWPDLDGFDAAHTGPPKGGAFVVRAPRAALEACGLPTNSAAELPVAEGKVWPPIVPCPECGETLYVETTDGTNGDEHRYLTCGGCNYEGSHMVAVTGEQA